MRRGGFNLRARQVFEGSSNVYSFGTFSYLEKNKISVKEFIDMGLPAVDVGVKGAYLDEYTIVERICCYSQIEETELYTLSANLNLHNQKIYIKDYTVDLSILYIIYLEKTLRLSNGFKALLDLQFKSVKTVFQLFANPSIQDELKNQIYSFLSKQKASKRSKAKMATSTEEEASKLIIEKLAYAYTQQIITMDDLTFWLSFPERHENWLKVCELNSKSKKIHNINESQKLYKPWLIQVRHRLLEIEKEHQVIPDLKKKILLVMKWIFHEERRSILTWLLPFLFFENWSDPKRKFLYIAGPPSTGKTFFLNVLLPPKYFQVMNRTFSHFGNAPPGDYDLHLLLFDDPGEAKNKLNQLETSTLLNLAHYDPLTTKHPLPVKFGYMNVRRGQVVIISNKKPQDLFDLDNQEAMNTRILIANFQSNDFPLKLKNTAQKPIVFQEMEFAANQIDYKLKPNAAAAINNNNSVGVEEMQDEDLIFYIVWRAILKILKDQLENQELSNLKTYIPNEKLCKLILDKQYLSIYDIICYAISEKQLMTYLYNDNVPNANMVF